MERRLALLDRRESEPFQPVTEAAADLLAPRAWDGLRFDDSSLRIEGKDESRRLGGAPAFAEAASRLKDCFAQRLRGSGRFAESADELVALRRKAARAPCVFAPQEVELGSPFGEQGPRSSFELRELHPGGECLVIGATAFVGTPLCRTRFPGRHRRDLSSEGEGVEHVGSRELDGAVDRSQDDHPAAFGLGVARSNEHDARHEGQSKYSATCSVHPPEPTGASTTVKGDEVSEGRASGGRGRAVSRTVVAAVEHTGATVAITVS